MVFCLPLWLFFFVLLWWKPLRFISSLALALVPLSPADGWKKLSSGKLVTAQSLWWALNSSWPVSADSGSQKGKTNKLRWCESAGKPWESQGKMGEAKLTWREGLWDLSLQALGHSSSPCWLLPPILPWSWLKLTWRYYPVSLKWSLAPFCFL